MSGHSKWATTKHKKAAIDAKRGVYFVQSLEDRFFPEDDPQSVLAGLTYQDQAIPVAPVLVIPGIMACVLALQRRAIEERLSLASRQSIMFRSEADNARELERQRIAADGHQRRQAAGH